MDSYSIRFKESAEKELQKLPKQTLNRVVSRIIALATTPQPANCQKLSGQEVWRIRQGDYRVLYVIDDNRQLVEVVKIGHRKNVYRR